MQKLLEQRLAERIKAFENGQAQYCPKCRRYLQYVYCTNERCKSPIVFGPLIKHLYKMFNDNEKEEEEEEDAITTEATTTVAKADNIEDESNSSSSTTSNSTHNKRQSKTGEVGVGVGGQKT
jgi:hypothetical protein